MTADLIAFLRARLDEDAAAAWRAGGKPWKWEQHYGDMCNDPTCEYGELATDDTVLMNVHGYDVSNGWQGADHIARHDPARVLREVEAKRRIIVRYEDQAALHANHMGGILTKYLVQELLEVVRLLALPYDDHPDYRAEWQAEAR